MSKFVTKNRICANFIVLDLPTNQDIEELFSVLSLFQDRLSTTDIKSITIYILKFHFKSFARQKYKQQKI